mgnify:CR=1 FL=1|jgi:hypothetical protein
MKRTILQAFGFAAAVTVGVFAVWAAVGYVRTGRDVPDAMQAYQDVQPLQQETSVGIVVDGRGVVTFAGVFLVAMIAYVLGKTLFGRVKRRAGK